MRQIRVESFAVSLDGFHFVTAAFGRAKRRKAWTARLFEGVDLRALGYECVQFAASENATHVVLRRQ
jgi:hypothetical protein